MAWIVIVNANKLKEYIVTEVQAAVDKLTAQLSKVLSEVVAATNALNDEIDNLKTQISQGQAPDLSGLEAVAQSLDDLNEDTPE